MLLGWVILITFAKRRRWCQRYTDTTRLEEAQSGGSCSTWMWEKDLPLVGGAENLNELDYGIINRALEFGKGEYEALNDILKDLHRS